MRFGGGKWLKVWAGCLIVAMAVVTAWAATQTINVLPDPNLAGFRTSLQTFLRDEDAQRYRRMFQPFVYTGGTAPTSVTLAHTITALEAFVHGSYVSQEATAHTYTASRRTYVYVDSVETRNLEVTFSGGSGCTAQPRQTRLLFAECAAGSTEPVSSVAGVAVLFYAETSGTAITSVIPLKALYADPHSRHTGIYSFREFGGVCDGTTDDTQAMRRASDATASGGTIIFPVGTCLYNNTGLTDVSSLTWTSATGVKLVGAGIGKTILKRAPTAPLNQRILTCTTCTDLEVSGITFDQNGVQSFGGLVFYQAKRVWIHHNAFINSNVPSYNGDDRYAILGGIAIQPNEHIWIESNYFDGLGTEIAKARYVHYEQNYCENAVSYCFTWASLESGNLAENYWAVNNYIRNSFGIKLGADAVTTGTTLRNLKVLANIIEVDAANAGGALANPIYIGDGNDSVVGSPTAWDNWEVASNTVVYSAGADLITTPLINVTQSDLNGTAVRGVHVHHNRVLAGGKTSSTNGAIWVQAQQAKVDGNDVIDAFVGMHVKTRYSTGGELSVTNNTVKSLQREGIKVTGGSTRGAHVIQGNQVIAASLGGASTYHAMVLTDILDSLITGNYIYCAACNAGIQEAGASNDNLITVNRLEAPAGTGAIGKLGVNTDIWGNDGFRTENRGTGTIPNGSTSVVISHNLALTPSIGGITITPSGNPTNDPGHLWVDTVTATQFTVHCRADPGAGGLAFGWSAVTFENL